jgi:hypothetical protein
VPDSPDYAAAFENGPIAQLLIDGSGRLGAANRAARALLEIAASDLGRPFTELDACVRLPQLADAVRSGVPPADDLHWPTGLEVRVLRIAVASLSAGLEVDIADVTEEAALRVDLQRTTRELAAAYQQLGATTEQLRTANDRLIEAVEQLEKTTQELRRARGSGV